ncbi:TPA: SDR family oxidoreductase [Candidatus Bathyarchaeota archaeon]|nr:SDR family oxidoreductase [Candidatus Bathyarchaeota archaeon]
MSKVMIVGGAGYVGSILARELLEKGYALKIVDRLYFGSSGISEIMDRIELEVKDMRLLEQSDFEDVEVIINLGGLSNDPTAEHNPKANFEMNTVASIRLAEIAKKAGVKRYILASSCSIYDRGVFSEEDDVVLNESSPVYPKAAYSVSKRKAEEGIQELSDNNFCTTILRKGTIYGFSPRMRYDLVVNTFVKDTLKKGEITVFYGGEMWRPLVNIHDVARAYYALLQAPAEKINGQIFNVSYRNFRISEVALRVKSALSEIGVSCKINTDYRYHGVRSYRVSTRKISDILGWNAVVSIEQSIKDMVDKIISFKMTDFDNPRYYNIAWMKLLEETSILVKSPSSIWEAS